MNLSARAVILGAALLALAPAAASALSITHSLSIEFSGATAPTGTSPWVTATFDDSFGGANTVRLTMSTGNLVGTETLNDFYFNFDPALDPNSLSFSAVSVVDAVVNGITTGTDAFKADGDGFFDFVFDFQPPGGSNQFEAGETIVYDISFSSAISAASFNFGSVSGGGAGTFLAAAKIQDINGVGQDSGWIGAVPEPSTALMLGIGLVGLGLRRPRQS